MNKLVKNIPIILVIFLFVLAPFVASAAEPLVPCRNADCGLCDLFRLAQNIINFLMWYIAPALAIFVIAWGGFNILVSGGNPAKKQAGIKAMVTAITGLLIVFGAWIVINEFLLFFSGGTGTEGQILGNPWIKVQCQ